MGDHSEGFVGIDTSKSRNAVAIAGGSRGGEGEDESHPSGHPENAG